MTQQSSEKNRQLLAWAVLIICSLLFVATVVAIPSGIRLYREWAMKPMVMYLSASDGQLKINRREWLETSRRRDDSFVLPVDIEASSSRDTGLIEFFDENEVRRANITMAGQRTRLEIVRAHEPKYTVGTSDAEIVVTLRTGRVRVQVMTADNLPPAHVTIETAFGTATTNSIGDYSFQVTEDGLETSVLEGSVQLSSEQGNLELANGQRAAIAPDASLSEPLSTTRSLVYNGSFEEGLNRWNKVRDVSGKDTAGNDEPAVTADVIDERDVLEIKRNGQEGVGNASVEFRQVIEQDVRKFSDLRLLLNMQIQSQSLEVCGSQGTECPLTVRMRYEDESGETRQWQQGFYAVGDPSADKPGACSTCPFPLTEYRYHRIERQGELVAYESLNLMESIPDTTGQNALRPVKINTLSLIAEGHLFAVDIENVALIANE